MIWRHLGLFPRLVIAVSLGFAISIIATIVLNCPREQAIETHRETLRRTAAATAQLFGAAFVQAAGRSGQPLALDSPDGANLAFRLLERAIPENGRIQLFAPQGELIFDSGNPSQPIVIQQRWYVPGQYFTSLMNWWLDPMPTTRSTKTTISLADVPEAKAAMEGRITDRLTTGPTRAPQLSVGLPVRHHDDLIGALVMTLSLPEVMTISRLSVAATACAALLGLGSACLMLWLVARQVVRSAERVRRAVDSAIRRSPTMGPVQVWNDPLLPSMSETIANLEAYLKARAEEADLFAKEMAHELKNPLTSLRSAVETAERVTNPEQHRRLMSVIVQDVVRLDRLISAIAEVSRVDAEMAAASGESVDLASMLTAIIEIENAASSNDLDPKFAIIQGGGPFIVRGLEGRLAQVFRNVLLNARSFSPPGARIRIAITRQHNSICVTCDDDGPGIPEGKEEIIFTRFYSDRPTDQPYAGHFGLGLSLCRQIVTALSGTITAENRRDAFDHVVGARFTVVLPAAPAT